MALPLVRSLTLAALFPSRDRKGAVVRNLFWPRLSTERSAFGPPARLCYCDKLNRSKLSTTTVTTTYR